jgi:3-dehydrosphinganine reductase
MVADGIRGKLVFVSSTLGFLGFAGYTHYSPTKYAVRGKLLKLTLLLLCHDTY